MFQNLIKHDLKSLNRILPVMHGALLITTLLLWFFMGNFMLFPAAVLILLYVVFLIIIICATTLLIGIHFYKSLFSDEGYLTHTLPVTSSQLLHSKIITGGIWISINITLTLLCSCIVFSTPFLSSFSPVSFSGLLVIFLVCILQGFTDVIIVYASVSIGHFFPNHPVPAAIITYFTITIARSLFNTICTNISGFTLKALSIAGTEEMAAEWGIISYDPKSLISFVISAIITIAILYPVTLHILKKKINLP